MQPAHAPLQQSESNPDRLFAASSLFLSLELLALAVLAHLATFPQ